MACPFTRHAHSRFPFTIHHSTRHAHSHGMLHSTSTLSMHSCMHACMHAYTHAHMQVDRAWTFPSSYATSQGLVVLPPISQGASQGAGISHACTVGECAAADACAAGACANACANACTCPASPGSVVVGPPPRSHEVDQEVERPLRVEEGRGLVEGASLSSVQERPASLDRMPSLKPSLVEMGAALKAERLSLVEQPACGVGLPASAAAVPTGGPADAEALSPAPSPVLSLDGRASAEGDSLNGREGGGTASLWVEPPGFRLSGACCACHVHVQGMCVCARLRPGFRLSASPLRLYAKTAWALEDALALRARDAAVTLCLEQRRARCLVYA